MSNWPSFEDLPPIDAGELGVWLSMTGAGNNWPTKARVVGLVGSRVGGDWWIAEQVARPLGLTVPYTSRLLAALEREGVLWRDGGSGGRLFWVEVNPRVEQWRGVDWTVSRFERQMILGQWRESAMWTAPGRLFARSCSARRANAVARSMSARRDELRGVSSRAPGARDDGGGPQGGSRALRARDVATPLRRSSSARKIGAAPQEVLPGGCDSENSPPGAAGAGGGAEVDEAVLRQARSVIVRKARAKFLNGRPLERLRQLLAEGLELEELVDLVCQAPDELGAPRLVEWVELNVGLPELAVQALNAMTAGDTASERERMAKVVANRRMMLSVLESQEPPDPEAIESCRAELEACETRLAELEQQEGAA